MVKTVKYHTGFGVPMSVKTDREVNPNSGSKLFKYVEVPYKEPKAKKAGVKKKKPAVKKAVSGGLLLKFKPADSKTAKFMRETNPKKKKAAVAK
jgi:hypothetical protein